MVEFPVCLMDAYLLSLGRNDIEDVKAADARRSPNTGENSACLRTSTIIFHDCYYSALFPDHQAWYDWLVRHLSDNYDVTDFASALGEIKAKHIPCVGYSLINHYAGSPEHGMEYRTFYFAREWVRSGQPGFGRCRRVSAICGKGNRT
jgi:hypothetical protein